MLIQTPLRIGCRSGGNEAAFIGAASDREATLKALMLRGLAGDAGAHGELLKTMTGYLRGFLARRMGHDAADLEDLLQETLLAIHLKRETYDRSRPFTAWAYSIARYKLVDLFRRRQMRRTKPLGEAEELFATEGESDLTARRDLDRLMFDLSDIQRALLQDVKIFGLTNAEAARKANMTETAVKVSIHRSIQTLKRKAASGGRMSGRHA